MPTPEETQQRHAKHVTGLVGAFADELRRMVNRAKQAVVARLAPALDLDERRRLKPTGSNLRTLRQVNRMLREEMERAGYPTLVKSFVGQFPGQMPFFTETLWSITERLKHPLPRLSFSREARSYLSAQQVTATKSLRGVVNQAAQAAENKALATMGALPYEQLVEKISDQFDISVGQAEGLAATSLTMYWRSVMAEGFNQIEEDLPEGAVAYYKYVNPIDKSTRDFCRKYAGKVKTREQWEALDNGSGLPVWLSCGGYRCRGHFVLDHVQYPRGGRARAGK